MKKLLIDGEIGYDWWTDSGVTAKSVQKQLEGLVPGEEIEIEINSPGGSVYEGVVIFNLIRDTAKAHQVSVRINCMALSMASYIALAARTVDPDSKITASDNSIMLIHNPYSITAGDYRQMQNESEYLEKLADMYGSVHAFVSGKKTEEIREAMDKETFYIGREIEDAGFANDYEAITQSKGNKTLEGNGNEAALSRDARIVKANAELQMVINNSMSALAKNKRQKLDDLQKAVALAQKPNAGKITIPENKGVGNAASRAAGSGGLNNQSPQAASCGNGGGTMKPEELLAQDKGCYEAVFALGEKSALEKERSRVAAHIKRGEKVKAMDIALKHIQGGKSVTDDEVNEEYFTAAVDRRHEADRSGDNVPPLAFGGDGEGEDDEKLEAAFARGTLGKDWGGK
jgi:ATP-dependent protease ClpP protease subunit